MSWCKYVDVGVFYTGYLRFWIDHDVMDLLASCRYSVTSVSYTHLQTQATTIDYDNIADIVSKRSSSTEDSVLKGYFKQQGLDEKQMGEAIASYKQAQVAKQQEEAQRISNLQKENERMNAQLLNSQIDTKASEMAGGLGVDPAKQPCLLKLIRCV